jgi:hypothetical protein
MLFAVYDLLGDLEDDMSVEHHLSSITADHATPPPDVQTFVLPLAL